MILTLLMILSVVFLLFSTIKINLHPFLALLFTAIGFGLLSGMPLNEIVSSINSGFGGTVGSVGIIIIAGTIIGTFLENSGGAFALAEKILRLIGKKHVPAAMALIGYFISIPVFADSGFVILSPLNKALSKEAKISLAGSVIALTLGLVATHCLVPPTPGPIAAAGILEADLGLVILLGIPVSLFAVFVGWFYAVRFASRVYIDPNPEISEADIALKIKEAPSAAKAFTPVIVPIVLIIFRSIASFPTEPLGDGLIAHSLNFIGEPVIALLIGILLAFRLPRTFERSMLSDSGWVGKALLNAAIIIMITGAGGAFGRVLQNSGIAAIIGNSLSGAKLGIWLPFILTASIKTAQGSSTVAIVTTASILAPLMSPLGFESGVAKALVVLSIGSGSMIVSHANDSMFWLLTRMSDMDVKTGYKLWSFGTLVMGCGAGFITWIFSLFLL